MIKLDIYALRQEVHQPMRDKRIKAIVAINPERSKTLRTNSLRRISLLISINDIRESSDEEPGFFPADSLQNNPEITIATIRNSNLFSVFSPCTPEGVAVFATKEKKLCKGPKGIERQDLHRLINDKILESIKANSTAAKIRAAD